MKTRAEELHNILGQQFDLCVIGGGATGSACALDAQLRGIRTVLLEAGDFAGSTSSAATKIIHGGVRYLEEAIKGLDLQEYHVLVRALHERVRMLENAPHLTRTLEFLVPSYHWIDVAYLDIGLTIYDWLAGPGRISPSKFLSQEETLGRMPELNPDGLVGSVAYADGQFDDARYNIALVETFTRAGGDALNYAKVTDFVRSSNGKTFWCNLPGPTECEYLHCKSQCHRECHWAAVGFNSPVGDAYVAQTHEAEQGITHPPTARIVPDRRRLADSENRRWTRSVCGSMGRKIARRNHRRRGLARCRVGSH